MSLLYFFRKPLARGSRYWHILEIALFLAVIAWIVSGYAPRYLSQLGKGPRVDIGYTTQNAAHLLFVEGKNPYRSETINVRPELMPEHRGFHYGPGMLIGYFFSAVIPNIGFKVTNLLFFLLTLPAIVMLADHHDQPVWRRARSALFAMAIFLLPERLWYETFLQGANDIFPVLLLLYGLLMVKYEKWFSAGIFMGFSFATKFSPAAFLLVLFLRMDLKRNFLLGCAVGALPLWVFFVWDFSALLQNVFILRFNLGYDSTSLYSITPAELHYLFPLIQMSAVVYVLICNFRRKIELDRSILQFTLLLILVEVTYKEIHANHLIWFYPFFAYLATKQREKLVALPLSFIRSKILPERL